MTRHQKAFNQILFCLYIAIGAGVLWLLARKFKKNKGDGEKTIILWGAGVLAVLNSPTTPNVEGVVSNFRRTFRHAKYGTETIETFTVDSTQFAYGDAALGKFNSFSRTNNNVIFDGQKVRVTYKTGSPYGENYNSILKLEIAK